LQVFPIVGRARGVLVTDHVFALRSSRENDIVSFDSFYNRTQLAQKCIFFLIWNSYVAIGVIYDFYMPDIASERIQASNRERNLNRSLYSGLRSAKRSLSSRHIRDHTGDDKRLAPLAEQEKAAFGATRTNPLIRSPIPLFARQRT
jgi:hypothetical protein